MRDKIINCTLPPGREGRELFVCSIQGVSGPQRASYGSAPFDTGKRKGIDIKHLDAARKGFEGLF